MSAITKKETVIILPLTLIIFAILTIKLTSMYVPTIELDEQGYLGIAAYFAGLDWTQNIETLSYYSYGYSILLYPLFLLFENPVYVFRGALVINALLISCTFPLCYIFSKRIRPSIDSNKLLVICLFCTLTTANIVRSYYAMAEALTLILTWIILIFVSDYKNFKDNKKVILLSFLSVYIYTVHQKNIVILIALAIIFLYLLIKKHITKQFFIFFAGVIFFMLIHSYVKDFIITYIWNESKNSLTNNFGEQQIKVKFLFSLQGLYSFFKNIVGITYYFFVSSFLIGTTGLFYMGKDIFAKFANHTKHEQKTTPELINIFLILIFLGYISITAIFMISPERLDQIVYGRYSENVFAPIMVVGLICIADKKVNIKFIIAQLLVFISTAVFVYYGSRILKDEVFATLHSPALSIFYTDNNLSVFKPVLFSSVIGIMIYCFIGRKFYHIVLVLLTIPSIYLGYSYLNEYCFPASERFYYQHDLLSEYKDSNVYFYRNNFSFRASQQQFMYFNKPIYHLLPYSFIRLNEFIEQDDLLISNYLTKDIMKNFDLINNYGDKFYLKYNKDRTSKKYNLDPIFITNDSNIITYKNNGEVVLNDESRTLFGPNISVEQGKYKIEFSYTILDYSNIDRVCTFAVYNETDGAFISVNEVKNFTLGDKQTMSFDLDIKETTDKINFFIVAYNSAVKVNSICIESLE